MTKTFTAAAIALVAMIAPAAADNCISYTAQIRSISSSLDYENSNITRYTAMVKSAVSVNDLQTAKMYASMMKNTAIRVTGFSADFKRVLTDVRQTPGMCGAGENDIATAEKNMEIMDKEVGMILKTYASMPQ